MMKRLGIILIFLFLLGCNRSKTLLWQWTLESRCYADPVIDGKMLYVVSQAGEVIAGYYETGQKIWTRKISGPILGDPAFTDQLLFVATQEGDVYALNKKNGEDVWRKTFKDHFTAPLTAVRDMVLAPSRNGTLYAFSQTNGEVLWSHSGNAQYNTRAVVHGENIYIGGWANTFYSFRTDGTVNWKFKTSHVIVEDALIRKNIVFFTAHDHYVYALDLPTGGLLWRFQARYPTNLLLINDELIFADEPGTLYVLHPDSGKVLRKHQVKRQIMRLFSWSGYCLYGAKKIHQVDPQSGSSSVLLTPPEPAFKIVFPPGMFVLAGETYLVMGFRQ